MSIVEALAELEQSSALIEHVAYLQQIIKVERQRREQFYRDFEGRRGEFINGQVFVSPAARLCELDAIACTRRLLYHFVHQRELGELYGGKCLIHCQRNDYEPAVCFFNRVKAAAFTPDLLLFPPPDLAVEVLSPATVDHIRKLKFQDYAYHGVGEYWIVDADAQTVEQYILPPSRKSYELKAHLMTSEQLVSSTLPDFIVPVAALFDGPANLCALQALARLA